MKQIWTLKKIKVEAKKYKSRNDFVNKNRSAYNAAWKMRILDIVCIHMKPSKSKPRSLEDLKLDALKYKTRGDFQKFSPSTYVIAHKKGVLDQICSHMEYVRTYWSVYFLELEAKKYSTRVDFKTKSPRAYCAAWTRGIEFLDKICSHMKKSACVSFQERELLREIKKKFPEAKKIKDSKVKIIGKPHIKGFEIDILVKKRGIEFDGTYYHSFNRMRADKRKIHWPDEDIHNYHQIKDEWFASKGIEILHIKEVDWNKDKKGCIKKCLNFLKKNEF